VIRTASVNVSKNAAEMFTNVLMDVRATQNDAVFVSCIFFCICIMPVAGRFGNAKEKR